MDPMVAQWITDFDRWRGVARPGDGNVRMAWIIDCGDVWRGWYRHNDWGITVMGVMFHCTAICPMGLHAVFQGGARGSRNWRRTGINS